MKKHTQGSCSNSSANEGKGSPVPPPAPMKSINYEDTALANSLSELLTGPPAVKRTLFTETQGNESDESSSDAEMDDIDRGNIINNL